ncbi:MAG: type IV secretory system conjugative DNA transfer family protein [Acetobacteraceae bacterium]
MAGIGLLSGWVALASLIFLYVANFNPPLPYSPDLALRYLPYLGESAILQIDLAIAFGLPLIAVVSLVYQTGLWHRRPALYGRTRFGTLRDGLATGLRYCRRPDPDGLVLGKASWLGGLIQRYVCMVGTEHVLLFAKTRAGKGISYAIPNAMLFQGSLVVLDVKGENFQATAGHRAKRLRQEVFCFAPLAEFSHRWNPLSGITVDEPNYISRLQRRAFDLFPEVTGRERFWQDGARSAFLGIATLVAETPELELNPATVFRFFTRGDSVEELSRMVEQRRAVGRPYSQICIDLISDYLSGTEEVVKGVRKHVTSTLGLWFNPKIAAVTASSDFDLHDLRRKRMTVYVVVPPSEIGQLGTMLRLLFNQLFEANTDVLPEADRTIRHRCHVLLDEFTSIPPMKAFAKATGFAAGYGLQFSFVVQSKNQVREEYKGQGEASLLENVGAEIIFGTNDPVLCKEASERSGYDTVMASTHSAPTFGRFFRVKQHSENTHEHRRALLFPQDVARMPAHQELLFRLNAPVFKLNKLRWFKDPAFRHLEMRPPELPQVSYSLAEDDGSVKITAPKSRH